MKRILLAFNDASGKMNKREELIKKHIAKKDLIKWSDYAVATKNCLYVLKVVQFGFPIQEFAGFDEVRADEILKELEKTVSELKGYLELGMDTVPECPKSSENDNNDESDRNDDEDDKSSEEDKQL